jgi:tryptophanyl-tRNA synthetase
MNNQIETYANITGFSNYQVSTFGNVKNIKTQRILKPGTNCNGYLYVILTDNGEKSIKKIHKLVANAFLENLEEKRCVDHKDRCKTNNLVSNLRYATITENQQNKSIQSNNTSGIVGVCWDKKQNKWKVEITVNGIRKHLGRFANKDDAITARANAEIQYFGEFRAIIPI